MQRYTLPILHSYSTLSLFNLTLWKSVTTTNNPLTNNVDTRDPIGSKNYVIVAQSLLLSCKFNRSKYTVIVFYQMYLLTRWLRVWQLLQTWQCCTLLRMYYCNSSVHSVQCGGGGGDPTHPRPGVSRYLARRPVPAPTQGRKLSLPSRAQHSAQCA